MTPLLKTIKKNKNINKITNLTSLTYSNFYNTARAIVLSILAFVLFGMQGVLVFAADTTKNDEKISKYSDGLPGTSLLNELSENIIGYLILTLIFIIIPVTSIVIVIKLAIIIMGFMGGSQGQEMANHLKHIFIALILLGTFLFIASGNNFTKSFFIDKFKNTAEDAAKKEKSSKTVFYKNFNDHLKQFDS